MQKELDKSKTKHEKIYTWIKDRINDGTFKIGEKFISENELCSMFNVSRHTVRHAFNLLETEGLIDRRQGSGTYIMNTSIIPNEVKHIGVSMSYLDEYIFPNILKGIERVLTQYGYSIILGITYNRVENERQFIKKCIANGVDGVISEASKTAYPSPNLDLYRKLKNAGIPTVFINSYYKELDCNYIVMDDKRGGYDSAMRLINGGHRKIGGIFKRDDMQGIDRFSGFSKAMRANKINDFEKNIIWFTTEDYGKLMDTEYDSNILNKLSECTGVVCYNDQIAAILISIFERHNIHVPNDKSIVSFDNSNLANLCSVKLTTMTHAGEKLGEKAAESINKLITGSEKKITCKFTPKLVERDSVLNLE